MARFLEVAPGVVQMPVLGAQVWLLVDEPMTLIDTGTRGSGRAIQRALERLGRRLEDLASIVLTHYHPDHAGALPELLAPRAVSGHEPLPPSDPPAEPPASAAASLGASPHSPSALTPHPSPLSTQHSALGPPRSALGPRHPAPGTRPSPLAPRPSSPRVAIHATEAPFLRAPDRLPNPFQARLSRALVAPFWPLARLRRPCPVDVPLADGDPLPGRPDARVVHLPGHTPGSIAVYFPARGLVLAGDAFERRGGRLGPPSRRFTEDWAAAWASIRRLGTLDFDTLCFSHFPPIQRRAAAAVRALADEGAASP